jgi:hypothetical protein
MKSKQILTNEKINYIRHFIIRNLKKINIVKKEDDLYIECSDSEDEFITVNELENE